MAINIDGKAMWDSVRLRDDYNALVLALREIAKGEGAFSLDPLVHASNTIDSMKEIAQTALADHGNS